MSRVIARHDVRSSNGKLLVAQRGAEGMAIYGYKAYPENYWKVPVKWGGHNKVYWHSLDDLEFVKPELDPAAYVAIPPDRLLLQLMPPETDSSRFDFGANMRYFRKGRELRQRELADRLRKMGINVSQTWISYCERQKCAPGGRYIEPLAAALQVPAFVFFINLHDCEHVRQILSYAANVYRLHCEGFPI